MSQKTALKNRPDPRKPKNTPKPSVLPVVDEAPVEELTGSEKFIESMAPHATTIGLVVVAAVLAVIAWGVYQSTSFSGQSGKWQEFSQSQFIDARTGDTQNLDGVANSYPDSNVGVMSALMSGDINLKKGLRQLGTDREKGLLAIQEAKSSFQAVVDADDSLKTPLVSRRAQYCLAYAQESLGKMDEAKQLYKEFVDAVPEDAALADSARRGLERCGEDKYASLYQTFTNYEEEVIGDAPGPSIPDKVTPGSFPEIESEAGVVPPKGDDTDTRMNADVVAEEKAAAEKAAAEKAAAEKVAAEKAAMEKAAAEKAAAEKAAAEKAAAEKAAAEKAAAEAKTAAEAAKEAAEAAKDAAEKAKKAVEDAATGE